MQMCEHLLVAGQQHFLCCESLMDQILVMLAGSFCHGTERTQAQTRSKNKSQQFIYTKTAGEAIYKVRGFQGPREQGQQARSHNPIQHTPHSDPMFIPCSCSVGHALTPFTLHHTVRLGNRRGNWDSSREWRLLNELLRI